MESPLIIKPLKQILFFEKDSDNLLFKVDCLDGRAKWKDSTKILSIKFQVSNEVEETTNLNNLKEENMYFDFEIIGFDSLESAIQIRFYDFTVSALELRSFTMSLNKKENSFWRYFIEGKAKDLKVKTADR